MSFSLCARRCQKLVPPSYAATVAMDHRWHDECFVCMDCTQPINGPFGAIGGKPICVQCIEGRKKKKADAKKAAAAADDDEGRE
jgi:hypothetical protein